MSKKLDLSILENADEKVLERLAGKPVSDEKTKKRIYEKIQKNLNDINNSEIDNENHAFEVSGVEVYRKPEIFRPLISAACLLLAVGIVGFSAYKNIMNNSPAEIENSEFSEITSYSTSVQTSVTFISESETSETETTEASKTEIITVQEEIIETSADVETTAEPQTITTEYISSSTASATTEIIETTSNISPVSVDFDDYISLEIQPVMNDIVLDDENIIPSGVYQADVILRQKYDIGALLLKADIGISEILCDSDGKTLFKTGKLLKDSKFGDSVVMSVQNDEYAEIGMLAYTKIFRYPEVKETGTLFTFYLDNYNDIQPVETEMSPLITADKLESTIITPYKEMIRLHGDWNTNGEIDIQDAVVSAAYLPYGSNHNHFSNYASTNGNIRLYPDFLKIWSDQRMLNFENTSCTILDYVLHKKLDLPYSREKYCIIDHEF